MKADLADIKSKFIEIYGREPRLFRAPGRVNLIGEHTDYNDGFVLPMAIEYATMVAAAARDDRKIRVHSVNLNESDEINLDAPEQRRRGSWMDFIEGVARILERKGVNLLGANLLISSKVPTGAGLSSSAALEISVGLALAEISGKTVDKKTLALAGQLAEHEYVGAKVGIMDQYVSALGKKGHALLIDCRSLESKQVPFSTDKTAVVIFDSKVKHDLAASEYNTRRAECEQGVEILKKFVPGITHLRDVGIENFENYQSNLPEIIKKRCRHIVTENERTLKAADALRKNDFEEFGRLMFLSHDSLRDDYEVSCRELDLLVTIAKSKPEVLGARMTGGGFGGSTVNLIERENLDKVIAEIASEYESATNIKTDIYISDAADGASELTNGNG